jgi:hypothetical protein
MLFADPDRQALIRFTVAKSHAACVAELRKPLRSRALGLNPKTGEYG